MIIAETVGGGLRKHLMLLLESLDPTKYQITFIHGPRVDQSFREQQKQLKNIKWIEITELKRELTPSNDVRSFTKIYKYIRQIQPDIVHCHSSKAGIIGRLAAKKAGVKKIFYTPHGYSFQADEFSPLKRTLFASIERLASHLATTKTFTVSKGEKQLAIDEKIDKPEKFQVIYNGLPNVKNTNEHKLHHLLELPNDTVIYGNCARLSVEKNAPLFVSIAQESLKKYPNEHFVWIGDGENLDEYQHIHPNIHFIGYRNDADQLVDEFSGMLFTSKHEGLPYALIEALRSRIPIVATNVAGNNEVVIPNYNGYLFDSCNVSEAVELLHKVHQISKEDIFNDFENRFSIGSMMKLIEENYRS